LSFFYRPISEDIHSIVQLLSVEVPITKQKETKGEENKENGLEGKGNMSVV
jgi:hypothetical protein